MAAPPQPRARRNAPRAAHGRAPREIASAKNPRVKDARALLHRRHRERQRRILLEGHNLIDDALRMGAQPLELFCSADALRLDTRTRSLADRACARGALDFVVADDVVRSLSDTVSPQVCCASICAISYLFSFACARDFPLPGNRAFSSAPCPTPLCGG